MGVYTKLGILLLELLTQKKAHQRIAFGYRDDAFFFAFVIFFSLKASLYYFPGRTHFMDGLDLLARPEFISQDGVHPSLEGIAQVAERWADIIRTELRKL